MSSILTSRAVSGRYYAKLKSLQNSLVLQRLATDIPSDQEVEIHAWLSACPSMKEWNGDRKPVVPVANKMTVLNKEYEASHDIPARWHKSDHSGQVMQLIDRLAVNGASLWHDLVVDVLVNAATLVCYDGDYFIGTSHAEGESGTQKNLLTSSEVSDLNVGTATAPTAYEMAKAIAGVIMYMQTLKNDQGRYVNREALEFTVACAANAVGAAAQLACTTPNIDTGTGVVTNPLMAYKVVPVIVPELSALTDKFYVARADGDVKPIILQKLQDLDLAVLAEGSERAKLTNKYFYGVDAAGAAAPGMWQFLARGTLV